MMPLAFTRDPKFMDCDECGTTHDTLDLLRDGIDGCPNCSGRAANRRYLLETGWSPMATAPREGCVHIKAILPDGRITEVHWACDLSGEEQPPFRGWFESFGRGCSGYMECYPEAWMPIERSAGLETKTT